MKCRSSLKRNWYIIEIIYSNWTLITSFSASGKAIARAVFLHDKFIEMNDQKQKNNIQLNEGGEAMTMTAAAAAAARR